jgi:hypothetical protein
VLPVVAPDRLLRSTSSVRALPVVVSERLRSPSPALAAAQRSSAVQVSQLEQTQQMAALRLLQIQGQRAALAYHQQASFQMAVSLHLPGLASMPGVNHIHRKRQIPEDYSRRNSYIS